MADEPDVPELMARLRDGDQQAAADVFHRFSTRLVALAGSRLGVGLQRKVDAEDIVQSAFRSFYRRQGAGEFDVPDWNNLWSLLALITVHKCGQKIRYHRAAQRDAGQEESAVLFTEDSCAAWEPVARDPTPSHAAMLGEAVDELMGGLDDREQKILTLSLQGYNVEEISELVGRSERTVRRVLAHVRTELEQKCGAGD